MKTYLSKTKIFALALVTLFSTSIAAPAFAVNDEDGKDEVSYVGNINNIPVYRLSLDNKEKDTFFVSITDKNGNVLYSEKVSGTKIVRNYRFDNDLYSEFDFVFTISATKGKTVSVYNVSNSKKIVNEVVINKVK